MEGKLSLAKEDLYPEASIQKLHPCLGICLYQATYLRCHHQAWYNHKHHHFRCKVRGVLHLGLVQHSEGTDPPSVLQRVQHQSSRGVLVCLKQVPMLPLGRRSRDGGAVVAPDGVAAGGRWCQL